MQNNSFIYCPTIVFDDSLFSNTYLTYDKERRAYPAILHQSGAQNTTTEENG